ncbi:cytochrome-c oxidase, cbb3-type subunit III [Alcanivorax sp. JB21]|uniref:cytochrome-c oxidase, cbb3-type subunit III n=1 Tax=Alcanivorax limicola TaxID=2874102 RepID=UPI001CBD1869|nr:cytochrome-c oxidase, cbb3-type subunit III [Alcanivorax limicola]MBZ2187894.1 cytochrome-c oxidase, cbb3-type subunit III [Alcanivorax limicola]
MSNFWSGYIIVLVLLNLLGCAVLLFWNSRMSAEEAKRRTTGHVFDGIEELNEPLPRWWLWLFVGTLIFSAAYLALYPGMGKYAGLLGWTSQGQWEEEVAFVERQTAPLFAEYAKVPVEELYQYPEVREVGARLYMQNCAMCHGSDARGARGYPSLMDGSWQWGGTPEAIKHTITKGRDANMPALAAALGEEGTTDMAWYVASLSKPELAEREDVAERIERAAPLFAMCTACHGADGTGNTTFGGPDLTDGKWVYGGRIADIEQTLRQGRMGKMPAHESILSAERIHVLTAYIYGLRSDDE